MSLRTFSQKVCTSNIKVAGAGSELTNSVYRRMRFLARVITATPASVVIFRHELVPRQRGSSCRCLVLLGGLELLTTEVVTVWVTCGNEYGGILEDVNAGGV